MSRQPSPGPSNSLLPPAASTRQKQKQFAVGISAGAEDAKYQGKYKDLKQKVKEIEADNDRLYFKVLQAKRGIQRMKLERAILYERLSTVPPSPELHGRHPLPSAHSDLALAAHHQPLSRGAPAQQHTIQRRISADLIVNSSSEYGRPPNHVRPPNDPTAASTPHSSTLHSPRRTSAEHRDGRHLPSFPPLPSLQHHERSRGHSQVHPGGSPPLRPRALSSHERMRSHSLSRTRSYQNPHSYHPGPGHPQPYPENLPPVQHVMLNSPVPSERDRERSRRQDMHGDALLHGRHHMAQMSPRSHAVDISRDQDRIHGHQRMSPANYIGNHDHLDRLHDLDGERERDRDREQNDLTRREHPHPSHLAHRVRLPVDRDDDGNYDVETHYNSHSNPSCARADTTYHHDGRAGCRRLRTRLSRSCSPVSASGSNSGNDAEGPSRPVSRTQYYEQDELRSSSNYRLCMINNRPNEDSGYEGRRSRSCDRGGGNYVLPEQRRLGVESRKRSRRDMDVDSENEGEEPGRDALYSIGRLHDDRGSKRYHREGAHRRSIDDHEDIRMGPS